MSNDIIEKVKQGLRNCDCRKANCDGCGYRYDGLCADNIVDCTGDLTSDALEVIEELQKENKALRLLVDWATECDFGFDQFYGEYRKYKDEIKDMGYIDGMIHVAKRTIEDGDGNG